MIPRQSRKISFYDEYVQTMSVEFHRWMLLINYILVLVIFVIFFSFDYKADGILNEQNHLKNNTDLYGKYGYNSKLSDASGYSFIFYWNFCFYVLLMIPGCCCTKLGRMEWSFTICAFIFNIFGAFISIPLSFSYLKDQIVGPDHQIISCDHIEVLDSWLNDWCTFYKLRIILSWLLIFVWFIIYPIYLFTILIILSKRIYRILKLWTTYQYQYRKGLFLTWLEKRKEKSMQQNYTFNDIKIVTAV